MAKFVLKPELEYWWPVKVTVPNTDPKKAGQGVEAAFKAQFRTIPSPEAQELLRNDPAELIKRVVIDWDENVVSDEGDAISFSEDALEDLLATPFVLRGFLQAWTESISGMPAKK